MKGRTVYINIGRGHFATIEGAPDGCLDLTCRAFDPEARYTLAYKEERWDGMVSLHDGKEFPVGLVGRVSDWLTEQGYVPSIQEAREEPLDLSRFGADYLGVITLHYYQVEAVTALLSARRGVVRSPTGSGKTIMIVAGARYLWEEKSWRSLVVVPKKGLAHQTREKLQSLYGGDVKVGLLADSMRIPGDIVVATASTLLSAWPREKKLRRGRQTIVQRLPADEMVREILRDYEVLWLDETHHASAEGWYRCAINSKAKRKYGLSGTPKKGEELADLRMEAATGPILHRVPPDVLIESGFVARPHIAMVMSDNASGPELPWHYAYRMVKGERQPYKVRLPYDDAYEQGVVQNSAHNDAVIRATLWLVDRGKRTLILTRKKKHWLDLKARLEKTGVEFLSVWGASDKYTRDNAKKMLDSGSVSVVLASTIWDEGEDVPGIDAVVCAEGVKVSVNALQRIGRGMRRKDGENVVWVVDFVPTCHTKLIEHGLERCEAYEAEGYQVTLVEDWPAAGADFDEATLLPFRAAS